MKAPASIDALTSRLDRLESELHHVESRLNTANRRLRATWSGIVVSLIGAVALAASPTAQAQFGVTLASLNAQLLVVRTKLRRWLTIRAANSSPSRVSM